ncbi:MAG: hypothetical protein ABSA02_06235 [Trebonia sp.]
MPEVSLYVAAITAAAAVLGAAVSPVSAAYQNSRQAVRNRAERRDAAVRQACVGLLRAARDLRVQAANTAAYHGPEMGSRLERIRQLGADAALHADEVALLVPVGIADSAALLAAAASRLATSTQANVKSALAASIRDPDFTELDRCIAGFSARVVDYVRNAES